MEEFYVSRSQHDHELRRFEDFGSMMRAFSAVATTHTTSRYGVIGSKRFDNDIRNGQVGDLRYLQNDELFSPTVRQHTSKWWHPELPEDVRTHLETAVQQALQQESVRTIIAEAVRKDETSAWGFDPRLPKDVRTHLETAAQQLFQQESVRTIIAEAVRMHQKLLVADGHRRHVQAANFPTMNLDPPAGPHGVGGLLFLDDDGDILQHGEAAGFDPLKQPVDLCMPGRKRLAPYVGEGPSAVAADVNRHILHENLGKLKIDYRRFRQINAESGMYNPVRRWTITRPVWDAFKSIYYGLRDTEEWLGSSMRLRFIENLFRVSFNMNGLVKDEDMQPFMVVYVSPSVLPLAMQELRSPGSTGTQVTHARYQTADATAAGDYDELRLNPKWLLSISSLR